MIENLFVNEVVRIIKKEMRKENAIFCGYGRKAVVLVSFRFHQEAIEELYRRNSMLMHDFFPSKTESLRICRLPVFPVNWLSDYEFEIRP